MHAPAVRRVHPQVVEVSARQQLHAARAADGRVHKPVGGRRAGLGHLNLRLPHWRPAAEEQVLVVGQEEHEIRPDREGRDHRSRCRAMNRSRPPRGVNDFAMDVACLVIVALVAAVDDDAPSASIPGRRLTAVRWSP
eukprot:scaffold19332_cov100-Isochrysis_galbana.AAC.1